MTTQTKSLRLADQLVKQPYAWPGGYPCYAITDDAAVLCHHCCQRERLWIGTTSGSDGWCIKHLEINWENQSLHCDHCSFHIQPAYPDDPSGRNHSN